MISRRRGVVYFCLLLPPVLLPISGPAVGQEKPDPRIEKVLADWKKRQERVKTVRYHVVGGVTITKEAIIQDKQVEKIPYDPAKVVDVHLKWECKLLLDFQSNRHRVEHFQQTYHVPTGQIDLDTFLGVFDGTVSKFTSTWGEPVKDTTPSIK